MNLPNKLTIIRMILIPICMLFIVLEAIPDFWGRIIAAILFVLTALTDMLDGMIARKRNLVTNFGKFLDPVADKLLIIGSFLAISVKYRGDAMFSSVMMWALFIIITREIAVTSLRMIASSNVVIPANILGKCKTVSQMICVVVVILEPIVFPGALMIPSYITVIVSTLLTIISGISYFKAYWSHINPNN